MRTYSLVVGECGASPEYFLHHMQLWEANAMIRGYRQQQRHHWEMTRWHAWMINSMLGGSSQTPSDMMPFPWEKEQMAADQERNEEEMLAFLEQVNEERRTIFSS